MSRVQTAGTNVLALTLILLALSSNIHLCSASDTVVDTVVLRNKLSLGTYFVVCRGYWDWTEDYSVEAGEETTLQVSYHEGILGWTKPSCTGWWSKGDTRYEARVYAYDYEHEACKGKCLVEVNSTGSFIWNRTENAWDLIEKYELDRVGVVF